MRVECPDDDALVAFAAGLASCSEQLTIEEHLDVCSICRVLAAAASRGEEKLVASEGGGLRSGHSIGRYRIEELIGAGAMGTVYRAWDPTLDRYVAVKVVHARWSRHPAARQRLAREAQALAKLSHRNVLPVFDVGAHKQSLFMAVEWVDGSTLDAWCDGRDRDQIIACFVAAGRGLAAAHDSGFIHRDFKPQNVLIGQDARPLVADFGLVAGIDDKLETGDNIDDGGDGTNNRLTRSGSLVGTPGFMAPEQLRGEVAQQASDQFAFCVALFETLFDRAPFHGASPAELLVSISEGPKAPPGRNNRRLFAVLARGLQEHPCDRYPSMRHLLSALEAASSRRTPWRFFAGAATLTGLAVAAMVAGVPTPCEGSLLRGRSLEQVVPFEFSEATRDEVASISEAWANIYEPACHRAKRGDAAAIRSLNCLEVERIEFEQGLAEQSGSGTGQRSPFFVRLGNPSLCAAPPKGHYEEPPNLALRALLKLARVQIAKAVRLHDQGKLDEALEALDAAWLKNETTAAPRAHASARLVRGAIETSSGDSDAGIATLTEAYTEATQDGRDEEALHSASLLMRAYLLEKQDTAAALQWDKHARALLPRTRSKRARFTYHRERVRILLSIGELEQALDEAYRGRELLRDSDEDSRLLASSIDNLLAQIHTLQGNDAEAALYQERILSTHLELYGPEHPNVATAQLGLAKVARRQGHDHEAQTLLAEAQTVLSALLPPGHWQLGVLSRERANLASSRGDFDLAVMHYTALLEVLNGQPHINDSLRRTLRGLSWTLERMGHHGRALELRERTLVHVEAIDGPESRNVGQSLNNIASSLLLLGRLDEAEATFRRAIDVFKARDAGDPALAFPMTGLGEVMAATGRAEAARPWLERALTIQPHHDVDWAMTATVLSKLLWGSPNPRDQDRALTLATEAEEILGSDRAYAREHADVVRWLETL